MLSQARIRLRHWCVLASLVAASAALPGAGMISGRQVASPATPAGAQAVRLDRADAARLAKEARQSVSVDMPPGLELTLWASDRLLVDPVAIDIDERGTVYVTSTSRNNMPLDIRQHPTWFTPAHTLKTVEDLQQFYRREMAPELSARNTWIEDRNKDGSHDWRDLSEFKERVYRIQDTDGDGLADDSRILIEGFNDDPVYDIAGGLLYHEGDLLVGVPPGVYRMRDENGDGLLDRKIVISEGYNIHPAFGGHGISGVTLGPDGRIYWEVGDIGLNVVDKEGRRWSYPNQGAVLRANPDGSGFEVFATGIRNLQEFSFDEYGNLISVDNDGDHEGESERLVYITEGSDSGWRSNWQYGKYTDPKNNRYNVWMDEGMFKPRFEGQAAHIIPPVAPWHAGPSGMAYNPGTALSDEWRNHFFVSSFPGAPANARVYAFRLKEQGAGFAVESEKVLLRGILVVGMKIGPDGALYLTDWITGWDSKNNGRLWKLDAPQAASSAIRAEVRSLLTQSFGERDSSSVAALLRHVDMRVRQKAQFELVRRADVQTLLAAARETAHRLARIHGLWGLGQLARKDRQHAALLTPFLGDSDGEIRAQAARLIGDVRHTAAGERLLPLLKDSSARARAFAAEALGRIAYKPAGAALVEMLAENDDRDVYLRHAGSLALSRLGDAPSLALLAQHPTRGVRIAAIVALRRLRDPGVARFLADGDERIVTEAARAINDDGSIEAALPALAGLLNEKRFSSEPFLRRAINANLRVGSREALERVAGFAGESGRPIALRAEAVSALGVWPEPSPLDRVDGIYLDSGPPQTRDAAAAGAAVLRLVDALPKTENSPALKIALADAVGRLGLTAAAPVLLTQLRADASAQVRLAALRALQALKAGNMDEVMRIALGDSDPAVRRAALGILPTLPLTDSAKVQHLASVIRRGSVQEQQGAFEVLGSLKSREARDLLASFLDELIARRIALEIQLDVLDAVQANGSPALQTKLDAHLKARSADSLVAAFREGLLRGGDERRGRQVFAENAAAGCPRCHAVRGRGPDVGPDLSTIGKTLSRDQLLQALIEPNARVAPGYGTVTVTLRSGQRIDGTLRQETETHLVLLAGTPPAEQRIAKADISQRTDPVSAMPPVGLILKPREIRDLVEFLSTLK